MKLEDFKNNFKNDLIDYDITLVQDEREAEEEFKNILSRELDKYEVDFHQYEREIYLLDTELGMLKVILNRYSCEGYDLYEIAKIYKEGGEEISLDEI